MKRSQIEIIITGLLAVLLVFLVARAATRIKKKKPSRVISATKAQATQPESVIAEVHSLSEEIVLHAQKLSWSRDPFVKAPKRKKATFGLILEGIIWDEINPQAIINNQIVKIGDNVNGHKVLEIKKDEVTLTNGKTERKLELWYEK